MFEDLVGMTALVTGASGGLRLDFADLLARQSSHVGLSKAGPMAFAANCLAIAGGSIARIVFSGPIRLIVSAPVALKIRSKWSNCLDSRAAASATCASSVMSRL